MATIFQLSRLAKSAVKKNKKSWIVATMVIGAGLAANAQVNVIYENFDPLSSGANVTPGYTFGDTTSSSSSIVSGAGLGGLPAWRTVNTANAGSDGYSGVGAQYQNGGITIATDANLSDYTLSFYARATATAGNTPNLTINVQTWTGESFGGTMTGSLIAGNNGVGTISLGAGYAYYSLNLGNSNIFQTKQGNFTPVGGTYQITMQLNGGGAPPYTDTLDIDDLQLTVAPEPGLPDSAWSGTWAGTYSYTNASCGLPNPGTIEMTLSVTNGVVSGETTEYNKVCYDTNTCQITGYGTISGSLTGLVSGTTITLNGNLTNSCNGLSGESPIGGTLSNGTITGYPSLFLQKQVVFNGGFETGDFTGWTLSGDTSDTYVDNGSILGIPPESGTYDALLGTSSSAGYLSQTLSTSPGTRYLLSFWIADPYTDPDQLQVSWNGKIVFAVTNVSAINWTNIQIAVSATSTNTPLQFAFEDNSFVLGLDNVSVVPEPTGPPQLSIGRAGKNLLLQWPTNSPGFILESKSNLFPVLQWNSNLPAPNILNGQNTVTSPITGPAMFFRLIQ